MVNITDVKQILQFAIDAEIKVFLDGGGKVSVNCIKITVHKNPG